MIWPTLRAIEISSWLAKTHTSRTHPIVKATIHRLIEEKTADGPSVVLARFVMAYAATTFMSKVPDLAVARRS